jgi:16S rRNA (guanine527-N7)-methyltransferase
LAATESLAEQAKAMIRGLWLPPSAQFTLSDAQIEALAGYLELLGRWNQVHSLTSVDGLENQVRMHILDALAAWPEIAGRFGPHPAIRVADVGSGMGVPGLVWAIVMSQSRFDLIERQQKKASFLRHVASRLGLADRVRVLACDVRQVAPDTGYDLITSRAFAALPDFLAVTDAIASSETLWAAMIGKKEVSDHTLLKMTRSGRDFLIESVQPLDVPGLKAERHIAWVRRAS